ncbi:hypothetical protein EJB05_14784, partial [Eragrostis curvula]
MATEDSPASERIVHSYKRSLNGFAARLTAQEAQELSGMEGVVSVFPSRTHELLTTRSWDFLGFPHAAGGAAVGGRHHRRHAGLQAAQHSANIFVCRVCMCPMKNPRQTFGHSAYTEFPVVSDEGFGPPPTRWKGARRNFTCNNKIIGARAYQGGATGLSPRDDEGHGSHTASTVAGRAVGNVSFGGLVTGTARGARLAVYKVCWDGGCGDADILAAFDDAIADGVDVISVSLGSSRPRPYFEDAQAIGSFHAMKRGVLTSASAGNSGRVGGHVCNVAPWMLSVAASSIDRRFTDKIVLGNGNTVVGASINSFPAVQNATLVFPVNGSCDPDDLAQGSYKGKIVLCPAHSGFVRNYGSGSFLAGAAGAVIVDSVTDQAYILPLPALVVTHQHQFDGILAYVNTTSNPVGTIETAETAGNPQSFHRDWSPAMVMSALITTATPMNTSGNAGYSELKYGAGQLNPSKARHPGLVYDSSEGDYVALLCAQGYNATQLALVTGSNSTTCAAGSRGDLNYPTMAAHVVPGKNFNVSFARTVTNVGRNPGGAAVYHVDIIFVASNASLEVSVSPALLEFSASSRTASYTVTVSGAAPSAADKVISVSIVWSDGVHVVRSPLVLYTANVDEHTSAVG